MFVQQHKYTNPGAKWNLREWRNTCSSSKSNVGYALTQLPSFDWPIVLLLVTWYGKGTGDWAQTSVFTQDALQDPGNEVVYRWLIVCSDTADCKQRRRRFIEIQLVARCRNIKRWQSHKLQIWRWMIMAKTDGMKMLWVQCIIYICNSLVQTH